MGARNETRGQRWGRRVLVATVVAVAVQVLGWLLLDGVAEAVAVWAPWPLGLVGMATTMPIARPGLPRPQGSVAQTFAPAFPSVIYLVPSLLMGTHDGDYPLGWFLAGLGVLAVVTGGVLWRRVRHHRRAPAPLVDLRPVDPAI